MTPRLFDPATDDVGTLAQLHASCFPDAWHAAAIRDLFAGQGVFAFVSPGGFVLARAVGDEAEILTLAVTPAARRQGIARALVRSAAIRAQSLGVRTLFLEVATGNDPALQLYAGLGFTAVGRRKAYYGAEDAHVLKAILPLPIPGDFA
jgi:ribosomal-protein-alanine N-acetyltransferase